MCSVTYGSPVVRGTLTTGVLDLEPDGIVAGFVVLAAGLGAPGHVSEDGAHVGLGPEGPGEGDLGAGGGLGVEGGGRAAGGAAGGVAVALDVDDGEVLDGAVAGDGAGDALRLGVHVGVGVGVVELVGLAADDGALNVAVGGNQGGRGQDSVEGTHFGG